VGGWGGGGGGHMKAGKERLGTTVVELLFGLAY